MDKLQKFGAALALVSLSGAALAQSTDPFDAAVGTVTTNATAYAGALVGIAAAVVVVMIAMKFVKRIKGAV